MDQKKFKLNRKQPFFTVVKGILRPFFRKPRQIIDLAGEIDPRSIIVANHSAKFGPLLLEMYFPVKHCLWGAGEMLGGYKSRFHYLRDVFYMQKRGFRKASATFSAAFEALFSPLIYRGLRVLPTFRDGKLLPTINKSCDALDANLPVMIFPENSDDGYFDVMREFFPGFVLLSQVYRRRTGIDVPVYPVYYHIKKRILVIGEPCFVGPMLDSGLDRHEVAEIFRNKVNDLYHTYVENEPTLIYKD